MQYLLNPYEIAILALKESEEKFSKAFHNSPLPITLSSIPDGCYLDVNDAAFALTFPQTLAGSP